MIFLFVVTVVVTGVIGFRTLGSSELPHQGKILSAKSVETIFVVEWSVVALLLPINQWILCIQFISWTTFFLCLPHLVRFSRERKFRREIENFLDRAILKLMCGQSFRLSCQEAAKECDAFSQQELDQVLKIVFFQQHVPLPTKFRNFVVSELRAIDKAPHSALNRLRGLRRNLQLESEFRRKSDQVTGRVRLQAVLMVGIFLATYIFLSRAPEFHLERGTIVLSVTIFVTGLVWTFVDGRRIRWKT